MLLSILNKTLVRIKRKYTPIILPFSNFAFNIIKDLSSLFLLKILKITFTLKTLSIQA